MNESKTAKIVDPVFEVKQSDYDFICKQFKNINLNDLQILGRFKVNNTLYYSEIQEDNCLRCSS